MEKKDALLLIETNPNVDIFYNEWLKEEYKADILFKKVSKPLRLIRRVWMKYNLPFSKIWLNVWINNLSSYKAIIIHMSRLTRYLPLIISKIYPDLRIICWYRNTIDGNNNPIDFNNSNISYWSFDENDCIKYGMKHNIQYYCSYDIENKEKDIDIYFVGLPKGREEKIEKIKQEAEKQGLACKFNIINNDSEYIPYSEVRKDLARSKAVLEINKENQVGFTLRTMESLFFGIKLITNNEKVKESEIFNKNNVLIIDNNYAELSKFINSKYDHSIDGLKDEYCLNKWFSNFFE